MASLSRLLLFPLLLLPGALQIDPRDPVAEAPCREISSSRERQCLSARCRARSASTSATKRSSSDQLIGGEALGLSPCQGCLSCANH
ncbi:hypothetical protein RS9917_00477 [Synechococcus sp. RS9917]|nr:hypothetical protein RS9917_00477 [Synechococcus sp. RS9917]